MDHLFQETHERSALALPARALLNDTYELGRVLGKGGFGITYAALDQDLQMAVAIKEYLPSAVAGRGTDRATVEPHGVKDSNLFENGLNAFLSEGRTLAKFNHPNIVRVMAFFRENGTGYLVMPFIEGKTLAQLVQERGGTLSPEDALDLMMPVLDGLRAVHEQGFLHRDIKPQNIFITETQGPILIDFGAARITFGQESQSLSAVLTPGYAPFEQYYRKGNQGPWTDVYAVAATLYRALTGERPPESPERNEVDELRPAHEVEPGVSEALSAVLTRALAPRPEDRHQSVEALQAALMAAMHGGASEGSDVTLPAETLLAATLPAPPVPPPSPAETVIDPPAPPSVTPPVSPPPLVSTPDSDSGSSSTAPTARLVLRAQRPCRVLIDGEPVGSLARNESRTFMLIPGTHQVRAESEGRGPSRETTVTLGAGEEKQIAIRLSGDTTRAPAAAGSGRKFPLGLVLGGGVGLIALIAIIALAAGGGDDPLGPLSITAPPSLLAGQSAAFSAAVPGEDNLTYTWDWGDGARSDGPSASHVYTTPGTYTVTVRAEGRAGSSIDSRVVTVSGAGGPSPPSTSTFDGIAIAVPYLDEGFLGPGDNTLDTGEYVDAYRFMGQAGEFITA
ncbi:MAG: protein kinase, partial [Rhodothermaceae bacterium]|nr:protein kinase [Rhodothermaceae bacterium]